MLQERVRRKVESNLKKAVGELHRDFDPSSADSCLSEMNFLFGNAKRIDSIPDTFFHRRNSDLDYAGTMFRHENEDEENEEDDEDAEEEENSSPKNMFISFASQEWHSNTQRNLRLKVRNVFFNFMTQLLQGYTKYIKVRDAPQISTPGRKKVRKNTRLVFIDKRSFVRSSSYPELIASLCDTQMFQHFLERLSSETDGRVQIFDETLKANQTTTSSFSSFPAFLSSSSNSNSRSNRKRREKMLKYPFTEKMKVKSTFVVKPLDELSSRKQDTDDRNSNKDEFPFVEFPTLCPIKFGNPKVPKSFVRSIENDDDHKSSTKKQQEEDEKTSVPNVIVNVMGSSTAGSEDDDTPSSSAALTTTTAASADEDVVMKRKVGVNNDSGDDDSSKRRRRRESSRGDGILFG